MKSFPSGSKVLPPAMKETQVRFVGQEDPLKEEMATYSSILAWEIPWTEEPGGAREPSKCLSGWSYRERQAKEAF